MTDELFGTQVRRQRKARGLTQAQLADKVGCVEDMIRKVESGLRRPSAQIAARLAEQLAIPDAERTQFLLDARRNPTPNTPLAARPAIALPPDTFVGREDDLREIGRRLLQPELRLLTLTGPGGVGKTRLALHAGAAHSDRFAGGVWLIELAVVRDAAQVLPTIAHALGVHEQPTPPLTQLLVQRLYARPHLLLLDTMEHVLQAAPEVSLLLAQCPELTVLATSRAALRVAGEHVYPVLPLALPTQAAPAAASPAVVLFGDRARAVQPQFVLEQHTATIAAICCRLDGLPLAIELAASRLTIFAPATLLKQLRQGAMLHTLRRGRRDAPVQHQSLRATIAWSYALLDDQCQRCLRVLAVFAGGATIAAITAVLYGPDAPAEAQFCTIDTLACLVDNSLVQVAAAHPPRFSLLETIRQFASEHLHASGELAIAQARHAAYVLHMAERSDAQPFGRAYEAWLDQVAAELDDVRSALAWLLDQQRVSAALRLAVASGEVWLARGMLREGRTWAERTLALVEAALPIGDDADTEQLRAALLHLLARLARYHNDYDAAHGYVERSHALYQRLGSADGTAHTYETSGLIALDRAEYATAQAQFERSLQIWQALDNTWGIALVFNDLGSVARCLGDASRAEALYAQSLALHRLLDDRRGMAAALNNLGIVAGMRGDYSAAAAYLAEGLVLAEARHDLRAVNIYGLNLGLIAWQTGDHTLARRRFQSTLQQAIQHGYLDLAATCLDSLGGLFADLAPEQAAHCWGSAEALRERIGVPLPASQRGEHARLIASAQAQVPPHVFQAAWVAGRAVPLAHHIATHANALWA